MKKHLISLAALLLSTHAFADAYNRCLATNGAKLEIQNHENRDTNPHIVVYPEPKIGDGFQVQISGNYQGSADPSNGLYTQTGETFASNDRGKTWHSIGQGSLQSRSVLMSLIQTGSGNVGVMTTSMGKFTFTCNFDWK